MPAAEFGYVTKDNLALFTDLYELTMLQGYFKEGHNPRATFDLFFRNLPENRGYVIAAGLEQVIHYLQNLEFSEEALDYLSKQGFDDDFLDWLSDFEFTGDVRAVPEGTPVFPNEPVVEVTAPIMQAQLLETLLINQVSFQSLIATKAARMYDLVFKYGDGQNLVDFGSRRAHGTDAGIKAARASYIGGFDGTSNVAAGEIFDIPVFGTMAHSWIQSFETELEAFEAYVDAYSEESILLIDTYDTLNGAKMAQQVADGRGVDIRGVRIDSGNLVELSRQVDERVDGGVFVSSGLDEYAIKEFLLEDGKAAGFGIGTNLVTSADAPKMEGVYKLVAVEEDSQMRPSMKLSAGKATYPGRKTLRRETDANFIRDAVGVEGETLDGEELLVDVFSSGELVYDLPTLDEVREHAKNQLLKIPEPVKKLEDPVEYPVTISPELTETTENLKNVLAEQYSGGDTDAA